MNTIRSYFPVQKFLNLEAFLSVIQVLAASLIIGLFAQIRIPLGFTPVPITGHVFAVLLVGALLGSKKGFISTLLYLVEANVGLPIFTGGNSGFLYFIGPHSGYFIGFLVQAYLVGWVLERQKEFHSGRTFLTFLLAVILGLGFGTLGLARFIGLKQAFLLGFLTFLPGDTFKALLATLYTKRVSRLSR